MTVKPPCPGGQPTTKLPVGRPKGALSTIVNVRLPLTLVAELDRYLDRLGGQTGLKANRGMIARYLERLRPYAATDATVREGQRWHCHR